MFRPLILAVLLLPTSAQAGKPSAAPTSSPEVIYTISAMKGYELKVASEDGTGAVTLYKGPGIVRGRFGPRADKTIAFYGGSDMYLLTYDTPASGTVAKSRRHLFNNGTLHAGPFDFSGTDIAWWVNTGELHVYNVATGADRVILHEPDLAGISFNPSGTEIFFGKGNGSGHYSLHRIPTAGGNPTEVGIVTSAVNFDSGHAADSFVIAGPQSGTWYIEYIPAGASSGQRIVRGIEASFNCDDRKIIYRQGEREGNNNAWDTFIYDLATGTSRTFSTDNGVRFPSYMSTC